MLPECSLRGAVEGVVPVWSREDEEPDGIDRTEEVPVDVEVEAKEPDPRVGADDEATAVEE